MFFSTVSIDTIILFVIFKILIIKSLTVQSFVNVQPQYVEPQIKISFTRYFSTVKGHLYGNK